VYWNVDAAAAPELVRLLTGGLNGAGVPFRMKVVDHPLRFDRCDAAVLYVPAPWFAETRGVVAGAAASLGRVLGRSTPAFTLPLVPGVGLAEDAGGSTSFGQRRCALLAEAVVVAHERREVHPEARLAVADERFAAEGVSLDEPYLEPALDGRHVL
jgi:hypothetical protein